MSACSTEEDGDLGTEHQNKTPGAGLRDMVLTGLRNIASSRKPGTIPTLTRCVPGPE